jgi:hypothetical protein
MHRRTANAIRAAAHGAVSEALRRVQATTSLPVAAAASGGAARISATPPGRDTKRTVPAPPGAPSRTVAHRPLASSGAVTSRDGAQRCATEASGDLAARRAWFDRWFDEKYPELARDRRAPDAESQQAASPPELASAPPASDLEPRQWTAVRLLLAGRCISEVARRLGADRHTVSAWTRDPAFRREVRRMAAELPLEELCPAGTRDDAPRAKRTEDGAPG